jgi:hypothetical protein
MNSDMGLMSALTVSLALVLDFLFLPTLLMKAEKKRDEVFKQKTNGADIDLYDDVFAPVSFTGDSR